MSLPDLFTQAQLEIACGGAPTLMRLAKKTPAEVSEYAAFVAAVRSAAESDVRSLVGVAYVLSDATLNAAPFISELALTIAVYWAHWKGTGGQEVPELVRAAYDNARTSLGELRDGPRMPGTETEAANATGTKLVTLSSASRVSRGNMGGFC